mgnify:CR=1 FL=1
MRNNHPLNILFVLTLAICISSCHSDDDGFTGIPQFMEYNITSIPVGNNLYSLDITVISGVRPDLMEYNEMPKLSIYSNKDKTPVKEIRLFGVKHESKEFLNHPYSESGNIVNLNDYIIYCDQWKRFESDSEKNTLIVYDLELNELQRIHLTQSGIIRQSNGRILVINDNLEYTILDSSLSIIRKGRIETNHEEIAECFTYKTGMHLPQYYFDGVSDIVSIVRGRTDRNEYIGFIINLTDNTSKPINWNFVEWGHWYPAWGFPHDYDDDENQPFIQVGYDDWEGNKPHFDNESLQFIYRCMAFGQNGKPFIMDTSNMGVKRTAHIDLNGSITLH